MTAQQLLDLLKDARPSSRYEKPKAPAPKLERATSLYAEQMPDWIAADLPELGGDACIVSVFREKRLAIGEMSTREGNLLARIECKRCDTPRPQQLLARNRYGNGETWAVLACTSCPLDLGVRT